MKFTHLIETHATPSHCCTFVNVLKVKSEDVPTRDDVDVFVVQVILERQEHLPLRVEAYDTWTLSLFVAQANLFIWFIVSECTQGHRYLETGITRDVGVGEFTR